APAKSRSICWRASTDSEPSACQPASESAVSTRGARIPRPTAISAQAMKTRPRCSAASRPSRPIGPRVVIALPPIVSTIVRAREPQECTTGRANLSVMSDTEIREEPRRRVRKRRSDGERSRNAILREAGRLATVEGMSKSGLFAHFGSKEELQVATIEAARTVFAEQVIDPSLAAPTGLERLRRLAE